MIKHFFNIGIIFINNLNSDFNPEFQTLQIEIQFSDWAVCDDTIIMYLNRKVNCFKQLLGVELTYMMLIYMLAMPTFTHKISRHFGV